MADKLIGPSFADELAVAGLTGLPFSWNETGSINYHPTITPEQQAAIEAVYNAHDPTTPGIDQSYAACIAAGIEITASRAPHINGTYAIDDVSRAEINSVATALAIGQGFPGGVDLFAYPDIDGVLHPFDADAFTAFAGAVRNYCYGLMSTRNVARTGRSVNWTSGKATIP